MTDRMGLNGVWVGLMALPLWIVSCLHVMTMMPVWWMVAHAAAALAMGGLLLAFGLFLRALCGEWRAIYTLRHRSVPCPPHLAAQIGDIVPVASVYVLDDHAATALCAGLLRPAIYVSTGLLTRLPMPALRAACAHEESHRRRGDPLRQFLWKCLAELLLPTLWTRELARLLRLHAELLADRHARRVTSTRDLAAALLAVLTPTPSSPRLCQLGLHDGETALDVRLAALTRPMSVPLASPITGLSGLPLAKPLPGVHLAVLSAWVMLIGIVSASPNVLVCLSLHS